jgi:hypothetical protein
MSTNAPPPTPSPTPGPMENLPPVRVPATPNPEVKIGAGAAAAASPTPPAPATPAATPTPTPAAATPAGAAAAAPAVAAPAPTIAYGAGADQNLSGYTSTVVTDILKAAGIESATITSTTRTPGDQARVMYDNIVANGVASQKALYAATGDQVIAVYEKLHAEKKTESEIVDAMKAKIVELGPSNVSKHCADPSQLNVVDIAPSSIKDRAAFEKAVEADKRVVGFLKPPQDPAYHLPIPQNAPATK